MIKKLYDCDADAIREIGSLSQRGISPEDIIVAYESRDSSTINYLYHQAKRLVELQELYKDLCIEYYNKTKDTTDYEEQVGRQKNSI